MNSDAIITSFWILESQLRRFGASGDGLAFGEQLHTLKGKIPQDLYDEASKINRLRSGFVHSASIPNLPSLALKINELIHEFDELCKHHGKTIQLTGAIPDHGFVIKDLILRPTPSQDTDYIHIWNGSNLRTNMDGWKFDIWDLDRGEQVCKHIFPALNGTFDPGEHMCVIFGNGTDAFNRSTVESMFPADHWDLFVPQGRETHPSIMRASNILVRLLDEARLVKAVLNIRRTRLSN